MNNIDRLADGIASYSVTRLSDVTPEKVAWLWPGHLPQGKIVVLDGDPGQGKSTVATDLAARISTGSPWPDGTPGSTPANVLLMSAEDGLSDTVVPRIAAAGGDLTRIRTLDSVMRDGKPVPPMLPDALPDIECAITDHHVRLLVVDVLMSYLDSSVNSYKDQDIRAKVMTPLTALLDRTGCTAILLRHLNKRGQNGGGSALMRGGGSIAIVGASRAAFVVGSDKDGEDRHVLAGEKFNLGPMPKSLVYALVDDPLNGCARVHWLGESDVSADQLVHVDSEDDGEREDRNACQAFLIEYLESNGGEDPARDVLKAAMAAGFSNQETKDARRRCRNPRIVSRKATFGGGWVWAIEDESDSEGGKVADSPLCIQNVPPSPPSTRSNDSVVPPSISGGSRKPLENVEGGEGGEGGTQKDIGAVRPLDLSRFDADQLGGLAHSWAKQLERDGTHSIDATLARMTPASLELLNQRGGVLKTATDLEYRRRSGVPALTA